MEKKFSAREYLSAPQQKNLILLLVVTGTLAFIAVSSFYIDPKSPYWLGKGSAKQTFDIRVQSKSFPAAPIVETKGNKIMFPTVEGQGTSILVGRMMVSTSTLYVLLKDPATSVTNLYKQDLHNTKIGLEQLTSSKSQKSALSVDPASGSAVYLVEPISSSTLNAIPAQLGTTTSSTTISKDRVTVYDGASKKEIDVGLGEEPRLLPGGFFAVYKSDGKILSTNIHHAKSYTLTSTPKGALFAVDPSGFQLAVYHPEAKNIQLYSLRNLISIEFKKSIVSTSTLDALLFDNRTLKSLSTKDHTFVLNDYGSTFETGPHTPELILLKQSVSIIHD